ncbi:MAG: ComEC/Rec2 family competence protein [Bacteroidales bacterium]|nr:ComEC/Rec2 family competence protein [Bacteroidales bacterium]
MQPSLIEEIRKYPFVRLTLAFIAGILVALVLEPSANLFLYTTAILTICVTVLHFINKFSLTLLKGIIIHLTIISFGILITVNYVSSNNNENLNDYKGYIIGEVSDDPKMSEKTTTIKLNIIAVKNNTIWQSAEGKTLLYIENDDRTQNLKAGNKIIFSPVLSAIENKGNPEEFDYKKYLTYNLIYNSDFITGDDWQLLQDNFDIGFQHKMLNFRQNLIASLEKNGLSNDELAVVSALALGYKDKLSDEIRHSYSSSGAMHILAVSGLHVGIIYGILVFIFSFLKSKRLKYLKTVLLIIFIWLYATLTGLSPSVCRAALMFSIMALGNLQNRTAGSLNAIALSAFILLVINPLNITNIGFQLSYAAVIGIILLYPKIYGIFEVKNKWIDKIWSLTAVSIAAQIATAPIGLFYFHQFSNYFILANYLLIPLSTLAIWICILAFIFSGVGFIAPFIIKVLSLIVKSMNYLSGGIESLPFSVSENIYISTPQLFVLYFVIIFLSIFFFSTKKYKHLFIAVSFIIVFAATNLFQDIKAINQKHFIIYNTNKVTAINVIDRKDNILFANIDSVLNKQIEFSAKNNWLKKGLDKEKYIDLSKSSKSVLSNVAVIDNKSVFYKRNFIGFNNLRIFVADDNFFPMIYNYEEKTKLDYVVLSNNSPARLTDINSVFEFKTVIIDGSNGLYRKEEWLKENEELSLNVFDVADKGAFIVDL